MGDDNTENVVLNKREVTLQNKRKREKPFFNKLISSETILLALIPLLAYFLLYLYESGFLGYYGVPSQYITFEISEVISITVLFFTVVFPIFGVINIFYQFSGVFKSRSSKRQFMAIAIIIIYLIIFGLIFGGLGNNVASIFMFLMAGFVFLIVFISPIFYKKYKGTYREKLEQNFEQAGNGGKDLESLWEVVIDKMGLEVFEFLTIFAMTCFLTHPFGTLKAYQKVEYGVIQTSPECAVIYTKTDFIICTTFDKTNKIFEPGYQIYSSDDLSGIRIINERIGPLHLKPTPTKTPQPTFTPTITNSPFPTFTPTEPPVPTATP